MRYRKRRRRSFRKRKGGQKRINKYRTARGGIRL